MAPGETPSPRRTKPHGRARAPRQTTPPGQTTALSQTKALGQTAAPRKTTAPGGRSRVHSGAVQRRTVADGRFAHSHTGSAPYTAEHGRLAQLGERLPYKQEVAGSSPAPPIFRKCCSSLLFSLCRPDLLLSQEPHGETGWKRLKPWQFCQGRSGPVWASADNTHHVRRSAPGTGRFSVRFPPLSAGVKKFHAPRAFWLQQKSLIHRIGMHLVD